jgi:hypothetical protein
MRRHLLAALAAGLAAIAVEGAAAKSLEVVGPDGQGATMTAADLAGLPRQQVKLDKRGKAATYEGPSLGAIAARIGAASGKAIHGAELATVIRVTGADGYQVVLGLAETDPATRREHVILADRADGAPLAGDGPFRLVVGGDLRPARSARNVARIEILRLSTRNTDAPALRHR